MHLVNDTTDTLMKSWLAGNPNNDLSFTIPSSELNDDFIIVMSYLPSPMPWVIGHFLYTDSATYGYLLGPLSFKFGDN